jgi:hypothetical protein
MGVDALRALTMAAWASRPRTRMAAGIGARGFRFARKRARRFTFSIFDSGLFVGVIWPAQAAHLPAGSAPMATQHRKAIARKTGRMV